MSTSATGSLACATSSHPGGKRADSGALQGRPSRGGGAWPAKAPVPLGPDSHFPGPPRPSGVHTGTHQGRSWVRRRSPEGRTKAQMSCPLETDFWDLRPGTGGVLSGFVSQSPGDASGNLNFRIADARAKPDFPGRTRGALSAEGAPRTRGGATPPHALRGRPAHSGRESGTPSARPTAAAALGGRELSEFQPQPRALLPVSHPGTRLARGPPRPARCRGTPGLNCSRIPGRCSRRRDPRSRPGVGWGGRRAPIAPSGSPHSPPRAPPVEPGGLSPQRRRRAARLAGAELLPGLPDPPRLRAAARASCLGHPDPPDVGPLCPPHPSRLPFLAFFLLPHPQTPAPPPRNPRSLSFAGVLPPCSLSFEGGLYIPVRQICTFRHIQTARDAPCAFGQVRFSGPQFSVCKMGITSTDLIRSRKK